MTDHTFAPTVYYSTIGDHPPALRIAPGDRVTTTTVDARGFDQRNQRRTEMGAPNPMTGPFSIEGAEPGDTLVVRIERVWPNRAEGWTTHHLAYHVVDPSYVRRLYSHPADAPNELAWWDVDIANGTATLTEDTRLGRLALPLDPMLGCFGVAPEDGQRISTATSGTHGGNMDFRGFKAGATVYFPVFVPGALFFLGDGHAVQGDGEIAGTGIEISMDVTFSVDLLKNHPIGWPRGENSLEIFTIGNARPLDQALQHATTEMARWLIDSYGLDGHSANLLMGQVVQYEIGNVFDPAYTVVCKMQKRWLDLIPGSRP